MIETIRRLVRQAFPGFPEHFAPRLGEVVAIADASDEEEGTDRFRPRYAVDVQPLLPSGEPDPDAPVLTGMPLPVTAAGPGRGIYGYPSIGSHVLYAFAFGLLSHPYILAVYPEGQAVPELAPGEILIQQADGAALRFDPTGNVTLRTDGELLEDSHTRAIEADESTETLGALTRAVDGDQHETIGNLEQTILGGHIQSVAGDVKVAILGAEDRTVGGDKAELVGGKAELVSQLGLSLTTNLGDLVIEAKTGSATVRAVLGDLLLEALAGAATVKAAMDATLTSTLGDALVEAVAGNAKVKGALTAALEAAKVKAGNGSVEMLALLDQLVTRMQAETHGTGVGPSTPPTNAADYAALQQQLATIKS